MSLAEQINNQYSKRANRANLYSGGYYVNYVQNELKTELKIVLDNYYKTTSELTLLEIGAGNGTNAFMFEELGFSIPNISFNELLNDRVKNIKINFPQNKLYEGDAIMLDIPETYDVVFQSTVFSSILNDDDRIKLANKMWALLKPGGIILWYDFIYNNPKNKDVKKITQKELMALFPNRKNTLVKKITLAPPIGRKLGRLAPLFNFPFLRTHILVALQK